MPFNTSYMRQSISSLHVTCSEVRDKPTFCNCVSNLLHSSFFCSMAISSDLSLESFFKPEDASEEACSFRSMRLDCKWTDRTCCQSSNQSIGISKSQSNTHKHTHTYKHLWCHLYIHSPWPPSLLILFAGCWLSPSGPCFPFYRTPLLPDVLCLPSPAGPLNAR